VSPIPMRRRMVCTALAFWFAPDRLIVYTCPDVTAGPFNYR
jgi:hypothetical protein